MYLSQIEDMIKEVIYNAERVVTKKRIPDSMLGVLA